MRDQSLIRLILCAAVGLQCASTVAAGTRPPVLTPVELARAEVLRLIGSAGCDGDSQCRTLAIGQQACGGTQAWIAYSSLQTRGAELAQAIARHDAAQAAMPGQGMSTCAIVADPGAVCVRDEPRSPLATRLVGTCRLRTRGVGGDGPTR